MSLLSTLSRAAESLQGAAGGVPARVWDELRPWLLRLVVNAGPKWVPVLAVGLPCQVPLYQAGAPLGPCGCRAIGTCDVCGRGCCLNHARIDQHGDAICYLCIVEVKRARSQPNGAEHEAPPSAGPSEDELRWARRQLGVKKGASWDEVRAAYRDKLRRHHPDRQRTEAAREKAEAKFKEIRRAYDLLEQAYQGSSGAAAA